MSPVPPPPPIVPPPLPAPMAPISFRRAQFEMAGMTLPPSLPVRTRDVRSTNGYVAVAGILMVLNCLARVVLTAKVFGPAPAPNSREAAMNVILSMGIVLHTIVIALIFEMWGRRVAKNHVALGHIDDRRRRRLPLVAFFDTAAMAIRGIEGRGSPRVRTVTRWSTITAVTFIAPFLLPRVFESLGRAGWSVDDQELAAKVSLAGQTALLVVAAFLGVSTMRRIARAHAAERRAHEALPGH